jgi:hypothetical protein
MYDFIDKNRKNKMVSSSNSSHINLRNIKHDNKKNKTFYVCSYGGSGSKMLCEALSKYGNIEHVHSRRPPDKLQYIGSKNGGRTWCEWFNGIHIPEDELKNYYVIYIYRNPSFAIHSRFQIPLHCRNIQCNKNINFQDVLKTGKDLYNIRDFYDNYTKPNMNRNYKIYSVKYEDIFNKQDELSELLGVGKLNLVNKSQRKQSDNKLDIIYSDLIDEMNKNNFITMN